MTAAPLPTPIGFPPEEIRTDEPTRAARLKWVIAVDASLPVGLGLNAAVCVAAATQASVFGLLGPDAVDSDGTVHPGLPWAGCTVVAADTAGLRSLRGRAGAREDVFVADMPEAAQRTRVYDEYRAAVATDADLRLYAVSVVGPRNAVAKLVKTFPLYG